MATNLKIDIGINEADRKEIAEGLGKLLADSYTVYLMTQNFHWNLSGPFFQSLHLLFERQYRELAEAVDTVAERIRALGYPAPATYAEFAKLSSVKEVSGTPDWEEMLSLLVKGHEACSRTARVIVDITDKAGDQPTLELIGERMRTHEKEAWMLRSHLETGEAEKKVKAAS